MTSSRMMLPNWTRAAAVALALAAAPGGAETSGLGLAPYDPSARPEWQTLDDGLAEAAATGLPVLVVIAPCPACGGHAFNDPAVTGMLADFVTVRGGLAEARRLGLPDEGVHALLLDPAGEPVEDLALTVENGWDLEPAAVIDLLSSGLDVLR